MSENNDSVLPLILTGAASFVTSVLGSLLFKNDASFYTGYAFGMWIGDASFNAECIPKGSRIAKPYAIHNTNAIHQRTLSGPAGLAITHAIKKIVM